ncbi:MAG TPA: WD40 repeat domain-containing protein, partial [Myxococcota bacterium]|nr:WD40 repeat domain-containing protein [Myxococcota bacterium]
WEHLAFFDSRGGARRPGPELGCCALPPRATANASVVWVVGGGRLVAVRDGVGHELRRCTNDEEVAGTVDETGTLWAQSCRDGTVSFGPIGGELREVQTGFGLDLQGKKGGSPATILSFTRDRSGLLMANTVGGIALVDLEPGLEPGLDPGPARFQLDSGLGMPRQLATSPDGRFAALLGERGGVKLLDLTTGQWRGTLPLGEVRALSFIESEPADLVTLGARIQRWRLTGGPLARLTLSDGVTSISVHPRSAGLNTPLVAVTRGKGLTITDLEGHKRYDEGWFDGIVKGGAFTMDGARYGATAGVSQRVTRFVADAHRPFERIEPEVVLSLPGREVSVVSRPDRPDLWFDLHHGCGVPVSFGDDTVTQPLFAGECPSISDLARSPSGRFLAMLAPLEGAVWLLDAHDELTPIRHPFTRDALAIAVLDDGLTVFAAEAEGVSEWVLGPNPHQSHLYHAPGATFLAVAASPSGRYLAGGARDGSTWLWERQSGELRARLRDHEQRVSALAFAGESLLLTGSWDWSVRVRSLAPLLVSGPQWVERIEARWGLSLDDVLGRSGE